MKIEIGKGLAPDVDVETLREHKPVWDHIVYIGLRNILMDAHASVKREDHATTELWRDAAMAASQKKLDAMLRGDLRTAHSGPRASHVDPVAAEALRLARVFVYGQARGWEKGNEAALVWIGKACAALDMPPASPHKDILNAAIAKRASRADVIATATANVDAANKIKVPVGDLGL